MEQFGGAPKIKWEGRSDIAAEAIGEEALNEADKLLGDLELELSPLPDTTKEKPFRERTVINPAERTAEELKTADEIMAGDPSQNIYYVQERPDKLQLSSVPTKVPIAQASYDTTPQQPQPMQLHDLDGQRLYDNAQPNREVPDSYDHVGKNFAVAKKPASQTQVKNEEKGFLRRLFGG
jgi:hypothetical protein